jgi:peptidase S41-like protein
MKNLIATLLVGTTLSAAAAPFYAPSAVTRLRSAALSHLDDDWIPKLSPFTAVEWDEERPRVRIDGSWYSLVEFDGIAADRIVEHCKERHGRRWQKRFSEDLVQVLWELGHEPGETVSVVLRDEHGVRSSRDAVPMNEENRRRVWDHNNADGDELKLLGDELGSHLKYDRVEREHSRELSPDARDLAEPLSLSDWSDAPAITREQAEQDLDQLEWLVRHRYSYRTLNQVDVAACFDAARLGLRDQVAVPEFELTLRKLLARFGDGHTRVDASIARLLPAEYAPFLVEHCAEGTVALRPDRSGLIDPAFPVLVELDGVPLDRWRTAAKSIEARGADHTNRRRSERGLRYLGWLRAELGLARSKTVQVTLANAAGERVTHELPVSQRKPNYGAWPSSKTGMLEGDIGYLRVERMDGERAVIRELQEQLDRLADARGLIIDVRDNGGGSRDILRSIAPRLIDPAAEPLVVNVAAYRLAPGEEPVRDGGYLENRYLFPAGWSGWTALERAAIARCAKGFEPDWRLPQGEFSEWHYMVVSPAPAAQHFAGPVCVLVDEDCFSATDVFLGALTQLPQVTLVGRASGGGSGRSRGFRLAHSGIRVRLSSMASFRPDGRRYDGRGIEVDVPVTPPATDYFSATDADLEAARRSILKR